MVLDYGYEVNTPQKIGHWEPLIKEWLTWFTRVCDLSQTVPGLNRKEMTNIGIFAGAVCRLNVISFPEMRRRRISLGGRYGFNDLWICCPDRNINDYIEFEGCRCWTRNDALRTIRQAECEAADLITEDGLRTIAVAFCNLQFSASLSTKLINFHTERLINEIRDVPHDLMAWCCPPSVRDYVDDQFKYPGIILLARSLE
jgi:hypothetical protein